MNNYDLSEVGSEKPQSDNISPYVGYGSGQILKINDIELKESQNTGAKKAILHMETKPINDENFKPIEGATGKVGRVGVGVYMNSELLKREFLQKMKTIAAAIGLESKINEIKSESFEEVVSKIAAILKGKYARYTIVASEYPKSDGKVGITLSLPRFKFVESENATPSTIIVFDKTNQYHYKKIISKPAGTVYDTTTTPSWNNQSSNYKSSVYDTPLNLDNPIEEKLGDQKEDFLDLPF